MCLRRGGSSIRIFCFLAASDPRIEEIFHQFVGSQRFEKQRVKKQIKNKLSNG